MTKTRSTKSALISSVLALVLCFTMLLGTTFAWFTDSVTSANNIIKSGTLEVGLYYADGKEAVDSANWRDAANVAIFDYDNWEPGYADAKHLKVSNEGSLDLYYQLAIVPNGEVSKLAEVIDVYYEVDGKQVADRSDVAGMTKVGTLAELIKKGIAKGELLNGEDYISTIVLKMNENAGNEYQNLSIGDSFSIVLFATQLDSETDSFNDQYDADAVPVANAAEAQAALDNAVPGTTIQLAVGVDYGTLVLRPVDGQANTITSLNEADGEGYTVYRNEYIRKVEDLTIIGAPGATVDAIKVDSGYIKDSGSSCNLVEVKGLVIDSVEFTDKADCAPHTYSAPIFFNLTWTDVDGLTVKNCKLIGDNDKVNFVYFTIDSSSYFDGVASNVTLTGNTVDGIARLCELRQTENVTITDNVVKNTVQHGMLLTVHNGTYTGNVTVTGNTAYGIGDRFVRMAGAGDATVVIKDNTVINYLGEDDDYIKVTDGTGSITVEPNTMTKATGVNDAESFIGAVESENIVIVDDIVYSNTDPEKQMILESNGAVSIDGNGSTITSEGADPSIGNHGYVAFVPAAGEDATVSDLTVTGTGFVEVGHWGIGGGDYTVNNLTVKDLESTLANSDKGFTLACGFCHYGNAVLNDCVMTGTTNMIDGAMPVDLGCVNDTTTVINGGEYGTIYCWSHSIVTIDGAEVDSLYVSPIKGTVTIKAGTHVKTLNVDYGTSDGNVTKARLEKLVIEEGATVDSIVFRGVTYSVAEWNAYLATL